MVRLDQTHRVDGAEDITVDGQLFVWETYIEHAYGPHSRYQDARCASCGLSVPDRGDDQKRLRDWMKVHVATNCEEQEDVYKAQMAELYAKWERLGWNDEFQQVLAEQVRLDEEAANE